jgi:Fe-S oxidoreductase
LLFPDTFANYFEPDVGAAAIELLQRAGCTVTFGPPGLRCCGRPLISNGLLDQAVANARHNVELLAHWAKRGGKIIACEPSCILTIKDDYPALVKGHLQNLAETIACSCQTFEEFFESILSEVSSHSLEWKAGTRKVLVQAHCHQRSLVGTVSLERLLRRVPGADVNVLDAGCCGMAGSFGYEIEHFDISRLVGEQRLLPAIRQSDPDAVVVASGFSCRLQIQHFTGRRAIHPAEMLRSCCC